MVRKVYTAKNGARYIKLANGQCRFISKQQGGTAPGYEIEYRLSEPNIVRSITDNHEIFKEYVEYMGWDESESKIYFLSTSLGEDFVKIQVITELKNAYIVGGVVSAFIHEVGEINLNDSYITIRDRITKKIEVEGIMNDIYV